MAASNVDGTSSSELDEANHPYLRYYVLFTSLIMVTAYPLLLRSPNFLLPNYHPQFHTQLSPLAARSIGAWFLLSGLLRLGAAWTWYDSSAGFAGWYDAALLSLAVPLWHYFAVEGVGWGSVNGRQLWLAGAVDGLGVVWMWWVRGGGVEGGGEGGGG